jgi:transposase InsO family protein
MQQVKQAYHLKNLGHKVHKFIACCDTCQRVKFPNRAITTEERSHLPTKPGSLCAIDLFGSLLTSHRGVKYILVCYDVFSKHVTLYPLRAATTRTCLNKLINHYFPHIIKPEVILSDNGTQFHSPSWKRNLETLNVQVRYTGVWHPQSNPSKRCMKEISKFFRIYWSKNHRKWAELIPHIESWLNNTVASATGFTPAELMGARDPTFLKIFYQRRLRVNLYWKT